MFCTTIEDICNNFLSVPYGILYQGQCLAMLFFKVVAVVLLVLLGQATRYQYHFLGFVAL